MGVEIEGETELFEELEELKDDYTGGGGWVVPNSKSLSYRHVFNGTWRGQMTTAR